MDLLGGGGDAREVLGPSGAAGAAFEDFEEAAVVGVEADERGLGLASPTGMVAAS